MRQICYFYYILELLPLLLTNYTSHADRLTLVGYKVVIIIRGVEVNGYVISSN